MNINSFLQELSGRGLPALQTGRSNPFERLSALPTTGSDRTQTSKVSDPVSISDSAHDLLSRFAEFRQVPRSVQALGADQYHQRVVAESGRLQQETSFSLELKTQEGDVISLSFQQAEFARMASAEGAFSLEAGFERVVNMSVTGELSEKELAAVDGLIAQVAEEASALFEGDLGAAAERLANIGFDGQTLASFALDFKQTSYQEVTRVYAPRADHGLGELARQDSGVASLLDAIAQAHRQLVEGAKSLFGEADAARLGKAVVPAVFGFAGSTPAQVSDERVQ